MKKLVIISVLTAAIGVAALSTPATATPAVAETPAIAERFGGQPDAIELQDGKAAATASVIVLFASNSGKGIDSCAAHLKALKQPPLSMYDSYACLAEKKLPLQADTLVTMATPDKGKLQLRLNEVLEREGKKPKFDIDVQVDRPDGKKFMSTNVKAPQGKYFFLTGPKFEKDGVSGKLLFAIQLN